MPMLVDTAELVGLAVEGPLYGIFLCMFTVCGYDLVRRASRGETRLRWPMAITGVSLIVLATIRFALNVTFVVSGFLHHNTREERLAYFRDVTHPIFVARHVVFITVQPVGDSFVIYRCWMVWGKNVRIIAFPVTMSIISTASGAYAIWAFTGLPHQAELSQAKWLMSFFMLSLASNAFATTLLAYRIWSVERKTTSVMLEKSSTLFPVLRIILESGLINVAYMFAFAMILMFGPQAVELMCDMGVSLTGIIFSIVILRVSLRRDSR
ncbi:hypothetical protein C8Q80DRAFT_243485 [Daedaleopsis nitida]|nr:hypothetical protein C8Q80DRAFT_243485 [Daedaleopsis nitida]